MVTNGGSNAAQSQELHLPVSPEEAFKALRASVDHLFKLRDADEFTMAVQYVTKVSALTWGDRCTAQVVRDGDGAVVRVTAASRNPNNSLAAGKSAKNLQLLFRDLTQRVKAAQS